MSSAERSIRNYLINKKFQVPFALKVALMALVLGLMNIIFFYYSMHSSFNTLVKPLFDAELIDKELFTLFIFELKKTVAFLIIFSLLLSFLAFLISIVLSHKVAGPMVAFKRTFNDILNGKKNKRIFLRKGDQFCEVAQLFNKVADYLIDQHNEKIEESEKVKG